MLLLLTTFLCTIWLIKENWPLEYWKALLGVPLNCGALALRLLMMPSISKSLQWKLISFFFHCKNLQLRYYSKSYCWLLQLQNVSAFLIPTQDQSQNWCEEIAKLMQRNRFKTKVGTNFFKALTLLKSNLDVPLR